MAGFARKPEFGPNATRRTGLFGGNAGEGRGDVVLDFAGGRERVFPDFVVGPGLAVLLDENVDFVGDFGTGAAVGFGFGSAPTGFSCSFPSFSEGIGSSGFSVVTPSLMKTFSKPEDNTVPGGVVGSFRGVGNPLLLPVSSFLIVGSSGVLLPLLVSATSSFFTSFSTLNPSFFWTSPANAAPSETDTTGLITTGLGGTCTF